MVMTEQRIGDTLKRLREEAGLSKRELAKRSGIDRVYIIKIEGGKVGTISLRTAEALAKGLGISPARFFNQNHRPDKDEVLDRIIKYIEGMR